jgi:hypothetical protein
MLVAVVANDCFRRKRPIKAASWAISSVKTGFEAIVFGSLLSDAEYGMAGNYA